MQPRFTFLSAITLVSSSVFVGCVSVTTRESAAVRKPAMPTIRPAPEMASTPTREPDVLDSVLRLAREGNTNEALRQLETIHDPADRGHVARRVVALLAEQDPNAAAALALRLPSGPGQIAALEDASRAMVRRDRVAALRWASELPDDAPSRSARRAVVTELVGSEGRAAIDRIHALPAGKVRDDSLVTAAAEWARRDPDGAIAWLRGWPDDTLKPRLISSVGFGVAQTRPDRAVAVAEMLPESRQRWMLFSAIAQTWVAVDSSGAHAWAGRLPAGEARDAAIAGIDTGLGVPAARRSASAPNTRGGSSRTRGGTAAAAAAAWPEMDSQAFAAWLATQRPGMTREEAILEYVRQRGASEPATVGQWVASLPGAMRDRAAELYLENVLPTAPSEAANWLSSLPRSDRTNEMVEKTARRLLLVNPDAGAAWMDQMNLPPYQKERLLREAGR
jgi:hypothetical protein